MRSRAIHLCAIASSLAAATLWPAPVHATAIFTQTIVNPLATVSTLDDFSNCRDNQGCLGKTGQVFDAAGNPFGGRQSDGYVDVHIHADTGGDCRHRCESGR